MNKRITNIEERNDILEKYPIENILSLLKDTLGENILVRDIATINNNIMLEVNNLDDDSTYFIKMTKILEEHPFVSRIGIIVSNESKTHFIKYMYTYTKDNYSSIICKVAEKYRKGNVWITKDAFTINVEREKGLIKENVKAKTR